MNKEELIKRLKSFGWRTAVMVMVALLSFIMQNIGLFGLPTWAIGIIGLACGEATKWLNSNTNLFGGKKK